jgi:hypothetical protein
MSFSCHFLLYKDFVLLMAFSWGVKFKIKNREILADQIIFTKYFKGFFPSITTLEKERFVRIGESTIHFLYLLSTQK